MSRSAPGPRLETKRRFFVANASRRTLTVSRRSGSFVFLSEKNYNYACCRENTLLSQRFSVFLKRERKNSALSLARDREIISCRLESWSAFFCCCCKKIKLAFLCLNNQIVVAKRKISVEKSIEFVLKKKNLFDRFGDIL